MARGVRGKGEKSQGQEERVFQKGRKGHSLGVAQRPSLG